jgi:hypothetical protein
MTLVPGTRLGPYEIVATIGAGGMGEVYRAQDTRLDRTVAVKILTQGLTNTPEVRQRFEREARAVSKFNHPHICALHDVGNQNGIEYLVIWDAYRNRSAVGREPFSIRAAGVSPWRCSIRRRSGQGAPSGNRASRLETGQCDAHKGRAPNCWTLVWQRAARFCKHVIWPGRNSRRVDSINLHVAFSESLLLFLIPTTRTNLVVSGTRPPGCRTILRTGRF